MQCPFKGVSLVPGVTEVARKMKIMAGALRGSFGHLQVGRKGAKRLPLGCTSGSRSAVWLDLLETSVDLQLPFFRLLCTSCHFSHAVVPLSPLSRIREQLKLGEGRSFLTGACQRTGKRGCSLDPTVALADA